MPFELRDLLQIGVMLVSVGAMYATVKSESKHQSDQHEDLKRATAAQAESLGQRIDHFTATVAAVQGDSREHGARITGLEGRVDRVEAHVDQIGRDVGVGRKA